MSVNDFSWEVGGPQGSGVDSAARLFAITAARAGLHVVGQREYYSNIMGEHSYYKVRASDKPIRSPLSAVYMLATYDEETLVRHLHSQEVVPGGAVLYDPETLNAEIGEIPLLDRRVKDEILPALEKAGAPPTARSLLEQHVKRGVRPVPVPYKDIMTKVGEQVGIKEFAKLTLLKNTIAVGASLGLLDLEREVLGETIHSTWEAKGAKVVEMNMLAADHAADAAKSALPTFGYRLKKAGSPGDRLWLQGTHAIALGKIVAGCRFQTYYPISPATDESVFLESHPESGVVVVQAEDEIAAVTMAIGSALTGTRASTSTSGPGFSLMVEGLGWAGIAEVPVVVVDYMRGSPSTGLPTRTEQGDLRFALHLGHGEFPRLVLAPGDIEEMFRDTVLAFNWAERYQTPVILLPDKDLAGNSMTVDKLSLDGVRIDRGLLADAKRVKEGTREGIYPRFALTESGLSPRLVLGMEGGIHWHTGDEHTEVGHITEDPAVRERMMEKRMRKLDLAAKEIPANQKFTLHGPPQADVTIVSWGGTKGPIQDALPALKAKGIIANFLQLRLMSPFPTETAAILEGARFLVGLEQNYSGQLCDLVREKTGVAVEHRILKYNGRPVTMDEVVEGVTESVKTKNPRIVLRHGV